MEKEIQSEVYSRPPKPNQWMTDNHELRNYAKTIFGEEQRRVEEDQSIGEKCTVQFSFVDFQPMILGEKLRRLT